MKVLIPILSIYIFLKVLSYGIYEIKHFNNKIAGISIIAISLVSTIAINVLIYLRMYLVSC